MAKTTPPASLLAQVAKLPPQRLMRTIPWDIKLQQSNPDAHAQLIELVDDWQSHGQSRRVFPAASQLFAFLRGETPGHEGENIIGDVNCNTFRAWLSARKVSNG